MSQPFYPDVILYLPNPEAATLGIVAKVCNLLRKHKVEEFEISKYRKEVMGKSVEEIVEITREWVAVQ